MLAGLLQECVSSEVIPGPHRNPAPRLGLYANGNPRGPTTGSISTRRRPAERVWHEVAANVAEIGRVRSRQRHTRMG